MPRDLGRHVYGLSAVLLGLIGLWWHDFATSWQPVPQGIPGRTLLALVVAAALLLSGVALQFQKSSRPAAVILALIYLGFALLWLGRAILAPDIFVMWLGCAEQLALVLGAAIVGIRARLGHRALDLCRLLFGLCLLVFGTAHFVYATETAAMVPSWLPSGQRFWALATGAAHIAAGAALLSGILALLSARLVSVMFVGFGLLVWLPKLAAIPPDHLSFAGNAVNLALVGSAWILADAIAGPRPKGRNLPRTLQQLSLPGLPRRGPMGATEAHE